MSGGGGRTVSRSGRPICAAGDSVLRLGKKWILPMRWVGEVERWRGGEADGESQRTAHLCRWGFGFAVGKKVVISLMKWGGYWNADGSEARASVPWLLKAAIRGGFTLGVDHFISEMAAFFQ